MNRAQTYEALGKYPAAIADYKTVTEIDAEYWLPHNNLAFIYAACEQDDLRDGAQSLKHAQLAFDLQPTKYWVNYGALAVAYAELGQFDKAIEMQKEAMERAPDAQKVIAKRRLRLFNEGQPYRRTAEK
ncbi:MAG: tetratricopeptide repeat protein [Planctomycetota bacterium]